MEKTGIHFQSVKVTTKNRLDEAIALLNAMLKQGIPAEAKLEVSYGQANHDSIVLSAQWETSEYKLDDGRS